VRGRKINSQIVECHGRPGVTPYFCAIPLEN